MGVSSSTKSFGSAFHIPLVVILQVLLGLYTAGDGHIDPYSLTQALATGARKYGATIRQGVAVQGMEQRRDGTWNVDTSRGVLRAKRIVNASGTVASRGPVRLVV